MVIAQTTFWKSPEDYNIRLIYWYILMNGYNILYNESVVYFREVYLHSAVFVQESRIEIKNVNWSKSIMFHVEFYTWYQFIMQSMRADLCLWLFKYKNDILIFYFKAWSFFD